MTNAIVDNRSSVIPRDRSSQVICVLILILAYSATTQYVVGPMIERLVADNAEYNRFTDEATLLTFMRFGVVFWTFLVSFLQALTLRLMFRGITRSEGPTLTTSWCWVLIGQIPFIVTGLAMMFLTDGQAVHALGHVGLRIAFGAISSGIYCMFAHHAYRTGGARLAVFFVIVTIVNSVLLVAVPTA